MTYLRARISLCDLDELVGSHTQYTRTSTHYHIFLPVERNDDQPMLAREIGKLTMVEGQGMTDASTGVSVAVTKYKFAIDYNYAS